MLPVIILTLTGVVLAIAIGVVAKYFGVEQDPRTEQFLNMLPGANCGGCGFAGCADYAKAVVEGKAKLGLCASMSQKALSEAAEIVVTIGTSATTPSLKIGDISEMVGYSDAAHFSRTFKKLENMSANEYRNTLRK